MKQIKLKGEFVLTAAIVMTGAFLLHLLRVILGKDLVIGTTNIPMSISVLAIIVLGVVITKFWKAILGK